MRYGKSLHSEILMLLARLAVAWLAGKDQRCNSHLSFFVQQQLFPQQSGFTFVSGIKVSKFIEPGERPGAAGSTQSAQKKWIGHLHGRTGQPVDQGVAPSQ
jgi:hypothetical protein